MIKKLLSAALLMLSLTATAQNLTKVFDKPRFSGYAIGQYQYSGQNDAEENSFNLRMVRLSLEGHLLNDFTYKLQGQINGNTSTLGSSPRLVDAFVEWQKYKAFKIKVGQFKRPFSMENPLHPIDQGFMSYAQSVVKMSGMSDRTGEHSSNGRDIGAQIQGDLLKTSDGRSLLHYQVGVFNGQGINTKDVDNRKDIIGGFWLMPVSGLRLGAFGWTGSYARKGDKGVKSLSKQRYAISGEYINNGWTFRSEYIHSAGFSFNAVYNEKEDLNKDDVNYTAGDKTDGFYVLAMAPLMKNRLHLKGRYDLYRPKAEWGTSKTNYEIGLNYVIVNGLQINFEYCLVNDRSLEHSNYSMIDTQLSFRF